MAARKLIRSFSTNVTAESRLSILGLSIKPAGPPLGNYTNCVRVGSLVFTAGHLPRTQAGDVVTGKLGLDCSEDDGYKAARIAAEALLSTIRGQ